MKILLKNETANKSTKNPKGSDVVTCVHATVHKSLGDGERFQMTWDIDMSNISNEEMYEAAAEYFIIKIRRTFAKIDKPTNAEWDHVSFDAHDYITTRASKTEKLAKTLAQFSDDDLAALGLTRTVEKSSK